MSLQADELVRKKWSLARAALYGFLAAVFVFIVNTIGDGGSQLANRLQTAPSSEIAGYLVGRLLLLPLLFVLVALIRNRVVVWRAGARLT